jgi:hypothetical protein
MACPSLRSPFTTRELGDNKDTKQSIHGYWFTMGPVLLATVRDRQRVGKELSDLAGSKEPGGCGGVSEGVERG